MYVIATMRRALVDVGNERSIDGLDDRRATTHPHHATQPQASAALKYGDHLSVSAQRDNDHSTTVDRR